MSHCTIDPDELVVGGMKWFRKAEVKLEDQNGDFKTAWRAVSFRGHGTSTGKGNGLMCGDKNVPTWRTEVFVLGTRERLRTSGTLENKEGMW